MCEALQYNLLGLKKISLDLGENTSLASKDGAQSCFITHH